jgi:hypothetical protein
MFLPVPLFSTVQQEVCVASKQLIHNFASSVLVFSL